MTASFSFVSFSSIQAQEKSSSKSSKNRGSSYGFVLSNLGAMFSLQSGISKVVAIWLSCCWGINNLGCWRSVNSVGREVVHVRLFDGENSNKLDKLWFDEVGLDSRDNSRLGVGRLWSANLSVWLWVWYHGRAIVVKTPRSGLQNDNADSSWWGAVHWYKTKQKWM